MCLEFDPPVPVSRHSVEELQALQEGAYRLLSPRLKKAARRPRNSLLRFLIWIVKAVVFVNVLYFGFVATVSLCFKFVNPELSAFMVYRAVVDGTKVRPISFVPLKKMPPSTQMVFIKLEDHDFYHHFGVSPQAIREAMRMNKIIGKTVYGGSTITQQLARNLFLSPDKNYIRKYLEAGTAIMLEIVLGKQRIMELYLNYIEFGPGIFGLGNAALYQYRTGFFNLSYEQRVRLAVIITSPLRYTVDTMWRNPGMVARYHAIMGDEGAE